jgi:hypothetical protein
MLNINLHNKLQRGRIFRYLLVLFLVLVAFYPLIDSALDACSDNIVNHLPMIPDARMSSARHNHHAPKMVALFQRDSVPSMEDPVFHFFGKRTIPAIAIKTSQSCPPKSSDLSPPVV